MKVFVKSAALALAVFLWLGFQSHASRGAGQDSRGKGAGATAEEKELAHAKGLFDATCARCHGKDGMGKTVIGDMLGVPDFTDDKWWKDDPSEERLTKSITNGKNEMPAFGKKLTKDDIALLAGFVRRFNKGANTSPSH